MLGTLKDLLDVVKTLLDLQSIWRAALAFIQSHRVAATLVATPIVALLGFLFIQQAKHFWTEVSRLRRTRAGRLALGVLVVGALALSSLFVLAIGVATESRPVIRPVPSIVGRKVFLQWDYEKKAEQLDTVFIVEGSRSRRSDRPDWSFIVSGNHVHIRDDINGTSFWRVRALEPLRGDLTGQTRRPTSRWSEKREVVQYETCFARVKASHRLLVAISDSHNRSYFSFFSDGSYRGLEIVLIQRIAQEIGRRLGIQRLEVEFHWVPWQEVMARAGSGEADLGISSITPLKSRETEHGIKFSCPYYESSLSLVHKGPLASTALTDILGSSRVGVQAGTTSEGLLTSVLPFFKEERLPRVHRFAQSEQAIDQLQMSPPQLDFVMTDTAYALGYVVLHRSGVTRALRYTQLNETWLPKGIAPPDKDYYAIATRDGESRLLHLVSQVISELQESGDLAAMTRSEKAAFQAAY